MKLFSLAMCLSVLAASPLAANDKPATTKPAAATSTHAQVRAAYPGLTAGPLAMAQMTELPTGVLLRAADVTITEKDMTDQIDQSQGEMAGQFKKNSFYLLEQMTIKRLITQEARKANTENAEISDENTLIQQYLRTLAASVNVSEDEIATFYKDNADAVGGAPLDKVKPQIAAYLRGQKQQQAVTDHIRTLGERHSIEVSSTWTKAQAIQALDNPVDKARASGKPSLVDFGSKGCRPCDMLAPILETLKTKYADKANVVVIQVREEQILAARYGIESIPVQIIFDAKGVEVYRHTGFIGQDELEKKLSDVGVK